MLLKGYQYVNVDGRMTALAKKKAVDEFTENHDCRVILTSITAGSTGTWRFIHAKMCWQGYKDV